MDDGINMSFISSLSTSQKAHDAKPIETLGIYDPATVSESTKQSSEASIGSSTGWEQKLSPPRLCYESAKQLDELA